MRQDFPWLGFVFWVGLFTWFGIRAWSRYLAEQERQKTLRVFAERGTPLDKEMLDRRARRGPALDESTAGDLAMQPAVGTHPSAALDLDRMLARIRPAERLCVVLCHAEGLSHAEIVAITGWPLGTVKSHVARGAARLRELLGEEGG